MKLLKVVVPLLLIFSFSTASAQYSKLNKDMALAVLSKTPIVTMEKESALLVAESSYECAAYFIGMKQLAEEANEAGMLPEHIDFEKFSRLAVQFATFLIAISEMIHVVHDITEEQDLAIMEAQQDKALAAINHLTPKQIDEKYEGMCRGILRTYLPDLFKGEANGA